MNYHDFKLLVAEMRNAQIEYFSTRATDWLAAAKRLEKQVDEALKHDEAQKTLFD